MKQYTIVLEGKEILTVLSTPSDRTRYIHFMNTVMGINFKMYETN